MATAWHTLEDFQKYNKLLGDGEHILEEEIDDKGSGFNWYQQKAMPHIYDSSIDN